MKLTLTNIALAAAAVTTAATGIASFSSVSESYHKIDNAQPQLDNKTKARLAWIDAARTGEIIYSPSLAGQKNTNVTTQDLKDKGLTPSTDVKIALQSVGLHYTN